MRPRSFGPGANAHDLIYYKCMNTLIKRSMMLGLSLVFVGAAVVPACAQKKGLTNLPKAVLGKKPPLTGISPVVRVPVTPRVPPTLQGVATIPTRVVPNAALNANVERQLIQATTPSLVLTPALSVVSTPESVHVLPDIGTPYLNISLEQIRDFLEEHDRFDRGTTTLERLISTFKRTDKIFFKPARDGYHVNENVAKNVTYAEVWHLLVQDTGFVKKGMRALVDVDFSESEIDGINIHDWIIAKHQELRNRSTWYGRYAVWSDTSVGVEPNPITPILKLRQQQISYALGKQQKTAKLFDNAIQHSTAGIESLSENLDPQNPILRAVEQAVPPLRRVTVTDVTTQRTAEEIKFLVENLDPQNSLRQAVENMLQENGYLAPVE